MLNVQGGGEGGTGFFLKSNLNWVGVALFTGKTFENHLRILK
jgi:hypothetical protein